MKKVPTLLLSATMAVLAGSLVACESTPTRESAGEYIDSSVISTKVRAKIADDKEVSIFDIDVTTFKDTVQLSGFVDTAVQKSRAGALAASVRGVRSVENNITIKN
jgi:osmotically-inducible protein OsmY